MCEEERKKLRLYHGKLAKSLAHFSPVTQSCLTLCNHMDGGTPGLLAHHQLLEHAHTYVHRVSDAIHPSHSLSSPSPPAFNISQDQGLFSSESSLHITWPKYWSFNFSISPFNEYSGLISLRIDWFDLLEFKALSRVFSSTTVEKHQLFSNQPSLWSNSHIHTWLLEKSYPYMTTGKIQVISEYHKGDSFIPVQFLKRTI